MTVLYSCYFGNASDQFPKLARVLEATARAHCPDWEVRVERIADSKLRGPNGSPSRGDNSWKLQKWAEFSCARPDGDRVLLLDTDTFVNAPLDPLWGHDFDLAYTVRGVDAPFPLNAGVIALRVNDASRDFMRLWSRRDREMFDDPALLAPWRRKYGGMNQASLGSLLEHGSGLTSWLTVAALPCREWNACDEADWCAFGPTTRIVHIKSALRMAVFSQGAAVPLLRGLARRWQVLYSAAD